MYDASSYGSRFYSPSRKKKNQPPSIYEQPPETRFHTTVSRKRTRKTVNFPSHAAGQEDRPYGSDEKFTPRYSDNALSQKAKTRFLPKLIALIGIGAILLLLAAVLYFRHTDYVPEIKNLRTTTSIYYEYDAFEQKTFIFVDGKPSEFVLDQPISSTQTNFEGNVSALLTTTGALYYVTEKEFVKIADNVLHFVLSGYGDAIAFANHGGKLFDCTVHLYNIAQHKTIEVDGGIAYQNIKLALSPNGKHLAYTKNGEAGDEESERLFLYTQGESKRVADNMICPVVTDNGDVYAVDKADNTLYFHTTDGTRNTLAANVYPIFRLNCDNTEIIFTADKKWYISVQGNEKAEIGESTYFIAADTAIASTSTYNSGSSHIIHYGVQSLRNQYYLSSGALVYLDGNNTATKVVKDAENIRISDDGKTTYYVQSGNLYTAATDHLSGAGIIAQKVSDYYITGSGDIYYKDESNFLWYIDKEEQKLVSPNVEEVAATTTDQLLFLADYQSSEINFLDAGTLYSCKSGNTLHTIAKNVRSLSATETTIYYEVLRDNGLYFYDVYASGGDTNFTCVMDKLGLLSVDELKIKKQEEEMIGAWYVTKYLLDGENTTREQIENIYGLETAMNFTNLLLHFYADNSAYAMDPLVWYNFKLNNDEIILTSMSDESITETLHHNGQEILWEISHENGHVLEIILQKGPVNINREEAETSPKNIFQESDVNFVVDIEGISYRFPLQYEDALPLFWNLEYIGWTCGIAAEDQEIAPRSEMLVEYTGDGGSISFVFYNSRDESSSLTDCPITAIGISLKKQDALDIVLPQDIRPLHSTQEEVRNRYGIPSAMSIGETENSYGYKNHPYVLTLLFSAKENNPLTGIKIGQLHK